MQTVTLTHPKTGDELEVSLDSDGDPATALQDYLRPGTEILLRSVVPEDEPAPKTRRRPRRPAKARRPKASPKATPAPGKTCRGIEARPDAKHGPPGRGKARGFCKGCTAALTTAECKAIIASVAQAPAVNGSAGEARA